MQPCTLQKISIQGIGLETLSIAAPAGAEAPTLVFLHEGLGSVRMWRDWPALLCAQLGCAGLVYSRQGYGQSDPVPDVRGPSGQKDGQRQNCRQISWIGCNPKKEEEDCRKNIPDWGESGTRSLCHFTCEQESDQEGCNHAREPDHIGETCGQKCRPKNS